MRCQLWLLVLLLCFGCEGAEQIADTPPPKSVPQSQYNELEARFNRLKADYQRLGRSDAKLLESRLEESQSRVADLESKLEEQVSLNKRATELIARILAESDAAVAKKKQAANSGSLPQSSTYTADNNDVYLSEERVKLVSNEFGLATYSYHFKVHRAAYRTVNYSITIQFMDDTESVVHQHYLGSKSLGTKEDLVRGTCIVTPSIASRITRFTYHLD